MSNTEPPDTPAPGAPPAPSAPTNARPRRRRAWRWAAGAGAALLGIGVLLAAAVLWLGRSETGSAWLLARMPGLQVEGLRGSLLGDAFSADRLVLGVAGARLELTQVEVVGLDWGWQRPARAGAPWLRVQVAQLGARKAVWQSAPPSPTDAPLAPPASLRLPVALALAAGRVADLRVDTLPALSDVQVRGLTLGADHGGRHEVQSLALRTDRLLLDARAHIGTDAPLALQLDGRLQSLEGAASPWRATTSLSGPLARLQAKAQLTSDQAGGPALDAEATLSPFAAWPLGALQLSTRALDLSALHAALPQTQLGGTAHITSSGLQAPVEARVALDNAAPGRWDEGRLPVRRLHARASGTLQALGELRLTQLDIDLASATRAGQLRGEGRLHHAASGQALTLALALDGLRPAALDRRLPAMALTGPLSVELTGLPALSGPTAASAGASAPATGASAPQTWAAALQGDLKGQLDGGSDSAAPPPVRLAWRATLNANTVELAEATATAGDASARLQGRLTHGEGAMTWQAQGQLSQFDPLLWWPGAAPDIARGSRTLNATLDSEGRFDSAARAAPGGDWRAALRGLSGQLALKLGPSQWAGVPLQGELTAQRDTSGNANARAQLEAGTNRLGFDGQDNGRAGQAALTLDAPALAALAPLSPALPRSGRLQGQANLRWAGDAAPRWRTELRGQALSHPSWHGERFEAQAEGGTLADDALKVQLAAEGLAWGGRKLDSLRADAQGSLREHRFSLRASSPVRPPEWVERVLGARVGSGSRAQIAGTGRWQPAATRAGAPPVLAGPGRWDADFSEFLGRAGDGSGEPWLSVPALRVGVSWNEHGQLQEAHAEPGRMLLPGTAVRWSEARYRAASTPGAAGQVALQAQIESFELAPLLARAQPELGWAGDLRLGGEIRVVAGERVDADLVFERQQGDLSMADDVRDSATPHRALGLSDLRLALGAHNGQWQFTVGLAGAHLGHMAGVARARTTPQARWPGRDAALDGVLQFSVAQLGAWGTWLPPGWRLGGELAGTTTLGGRWGAPELSGQLTGRKLEARNALQGVHFNDGTVDIRLEGDHAHIERFEWRGGDGWLRVTGDAQLGNEPRADLTLLAERLRVLGRIDRRIVASGQAKLVFKERAADLSGALRLDEGLIDFSRGGAPELDGDVRVRDPADLSAEANPEGKATAASANAQPFTSRLKLALDLGPSLRVRGRGLDTLLRGTLDIDNPAGRLAVRGDVRAERGTYAAYGQKLRIDRGTITFTGPLEDPRLDVLALRPNLDVEVGVAVTGSALNPRVKLYSSPEMSDTDKLSWLVLGREPDGLGRADSALLQRAAVALLAGEGEAPTDTFLAQIGLSDFGVRQTGEGAEQTTVVSLGKQLTRRWYVGYERSVNATTGTWQLIYRIAQRFTLRAQSGEDSAVDLIWAWRWN